MLFTHPASNTNKTNNETAINTVHEVFRFAWFKVFVLQNQEYVIEKINKSNVKKGEAKRVRRGKICTEDDRRWGRTHV